jgi:hypothetical protein
LLLRQIQNNPKIQKRLILFIFIFIVFITPDFSLSKYNKLCTIPGNSDLKIRNLT